MKLISTRGRILLDQATTKRRLETPDHGHAVFEEIRRQLEVTAAIDALLKTYQREAFAHLCRQVRLTADVNQMMLKGEWDARKNSNA